MANAISPCSTGPGVRRPGRRALVSVASAGSPSRIAVVAHRTTATLPSVYGQAVNGQGRRARRNRLTPGSDLTGRYRSAVTIALRLALRRGLTLPRSLPLENLRRRLATGRSSTFQLHISSITRPPL